MSNEIDILKHTPTPDYIDTTGRYYSCMDCEWDGDISECDFDTYYDEFSGNDIVYPICPECDGALDY